MVNDSLAESLIKQQKVQIISKESPANATKYILKCIQFPSLNCSCGKIIQHIKTIICDI